MKAAADNFTFSIRTKCDMIIPIFETLTEEMLMEENKNTAAVTEDGKETVSDGIFG